MVFKNIKIIAIILFLIICALGLFPEKIGVLEELGRPDMVDVDGERIYATEGATMIIPIRKPGNCTPLLFIEIKKRCPLSLPHLGFYYRFKMMNSHDIMLCGGYP